MNNEDLNKLLPWYANNTLEEEEKKAVEAYLEQSDAAREELALIKNMAQQITSEPAADVSELAWRRLKKQIEADQKQSNKNQTKIKTPIPNWAASLGVAAMLVIALQLTFVFQPTQDNAANTKLLSSMPAAMLEPHWLLQLAVAPNAEWHDITEALASVQGVIVDGPSSIGLLHIAVPIKGSRFKAPQALVEWLKIQPAITHIALENG